MKIFFEKMRHLSRDVDVTYHAYSTVSNTVIDFDISLSYKNNIGLRIE